MTAQSATFAAPLASIAQLPGFTVARVDATQPCTACAKLLRRGELAYSSPTGTVICVDHTAALPFI